MIAETPRRLGRFALSVLQNHAGAVPRPSWCTYLVSYHCNARCTMCDSWRVKRGHEMNPAEVAQVFSRIGRLEIVRLTGGEPFLREDLLEIALAVRAASSPSVVHITTNGSLPTRIDELLQKHPERSTLQMMVSLDGAEATHDRNRGDEVTYAQALESIRIIVGHGVRVSVNHTVISPQSMDENAEIRRALAPLGVEVHSVLAYADSAMYGRKLRGKRAEHLVVPDGYPLHPALEGADVEGFVERELAATEQMRSPRDRIGKRYYLRGLASRLRRDTDAEPRPRCVALRSHIRVLPDGRVPVCQFNTETIGNLRTQSFDDVWHANEAYRQRRWVDACPGCWAECEVIPSAVYTGDILRALL